MVNCVINEELKHLAIHVPQITFLSQYMPKKGESEFAMNSNFFFNMLQACAIGTQLALLTLVIIPSLFLIQSHSGKSWRLCELRHNGCRTARHSPNYVTQLSVTSAIHNPQSRISDVLEKNFKKRGRGGK